MRVPSRLSFYQNAADDRVLLGIHHENQIGFCGWSRWHCSMFVVVHQWGNHSPCHKKTVSFFSLSFVSVRPSIATNTCTTPIAVKGRLTCSNLSIRRLHCFFFWLRCVDFSSIVVAVIVPRGIVSVCPSQKFIRRHISSFSPHSPSFLSVSMTSWCPRLLVTCCWRRSALQVQQRFHSSGRPSKWYPSSQWHLYPRVASCPTLYRLQTWFARTLFWPDSNSLSNWLDALLHVQLCRQFLVWPPIHLLWTNSFVPSSVPNSILLFQHYCSSNLSIRQLNFNFVTFRHLILHSIFAEVFHLAFIVSASCLVHFTSARHQPWHVAFVSLDWTALEQLSHPRSILEYVLQFLNYQSRSCWLSVFATRFHPVCDLNLFVCLTCRRAPPFREIFSASTHRDVYSFLFWNFVFVRLPHCTCLGLPCFRPCWACFRLYARARLSTFLDVVLSSIRFSFSTVSRRVSVNSTSWTVSIDFWSWLSITEKPIATDCVFLRVNLHISIYFTNLVHSFE